MLTPATYGLKTDTYTSTTIQGTGLQAGQMHQVANTNTYRMLVRNNTSGGTITDGETLMFTSGSAASYVVDASTGTGTPVIGVNDCVGGSVAAGTYFWCTVHGFCYPLVATGRSVNDLLGPSATAGTLDARTTAQQANILLCAANSSGSPTKTLSYIF